MVHTVWIWANQLKLAYNLSVEIDNDKLKTWSSTKNQIGDLEKSL